MNGTNAIVDNSPSPKYAARRFAPLAFVQRGRLAACALALLPALFFPVTGHAADEVPPSPPKLLICTPPCDESTGAYAITFSNPFDRMDVDGKLQSQSKPSISVAPGQTEGRLIELQFQKAGPVTLSFDAGGNFSNDNIKSRWYVEWYQGNTVNLSPKRLDSGRRLIKELLLSNPKLISVDKTKQTNSIWVNNERYVNISDLKTVPNKRSIDVGQTIVDAQTLQPIDQSGQPVTAYITVTAPKNQAPGTYIKKLNVLLNNKVIAQKDIEIKVLPFTLQPSPVQHSIFYRAAIDLKNIAYISSEYKSANQVRADMKNMIEHGITNPVIYQDALDKSAFQQYMAIRNEVGMDKEPLFYLGHPIRKNFTGTVLDRALTDYKALEQLSAGSKTLSIYGIDEAKGDELTAQYAVWETLRNKKYEIFASGHVESVPQIKGRINTFIMAYKPNLKIARELHQAGTKIYMYANPQGGYEDPLVYRENYGFPLWQAEYDGAMTYAYQHTDRYNIWDDFESTEFRPHNFAYPTSDGVVDTIQWESYRAGVDDLRYLQTFIVLFNEKKATLPAATRTELEQWLAGVKTKLPGSAQQTREAIIANILKIQAATSAN